MNAARPGGSVPGRQYINRNREAGHWRLYEDYFSDDPTYGPTFFHRRFVNGLFLFVRHFCSSSWVRLILITFFRFRMARSLFLRILQAVEQHDNYFVQKRDRNGRLGLSPLQKITASFRMLTYGLAADAIDDYIRIGESTAIESLKRFVKAIIEVFGDEYLRSPNNNDTARLLAIGEQNGFPGMLGSIDCMHWKWKNCPAAWQGQFTGHVHEPTIILEAVASHDLWIWHAFFGLPGSHNDINVLHRSHLFAKLAEGHAPKVNYTINSHNYTMGYYLADGIYPQWATFVKPIPSPQGNKRKYFTKVQAAMRKEVERAFGVLQARFAIVRGPARFWDQDTLGQIMTACIIMHNMIVEDERDAEGDHHFDEMGEVVTVSHRPTAELQAFLQTHQAITNRETHSQLRDDLVEHLWEKYGGV
ncbi:uncharacterized protein LOC133892271 [Phragmites australis]|uniref:uncharacterized protein LOC133892271 n=1 Tax=Phragmites australis TaxID=29695 RepID=UPI002D79B658|nr:uncharacterized protein LOC133892271 [Phragmites australis]